MTVDEISARLRARLQEEYGVDEAAILMDRPPGGWGDLVTNQSLDRRLSDFNARIDARFDAVEARFGDVNARIDARFDAVDARFGDFNARIDAKFEAVDARFGELKHELTSTMAQEFKTQTWRLVSAMFSAMTLLVAIVAVVVAIFAKN